MLVSKRISLRASNFEFYECKKEKIIIGVNMFHLFKLINSIDNDDTLTIYIENNDFLKIGRWKINNRREFNIRYF